MGQKITDVELYKLVRFSFLLFILMTANILCACASSEEDYKQSKDEINSAEDKNLLVNKTPSDFYTATIIDRKTWLVSDTSNILWRTTDSGNGWKMIFKSSSLIEEPSFINSEIGFVISDNILKKTRDGGNSWISVQKINQDFKKLFFFNENMGWAVGSIFTSESGTEGKIWHTRDGGLSWEEQEITDRQNLVNSKGKRWNLKDIYFLTESVGWAAGKGVLLYTKDGGKNWKADIDIEGDFEKVRFINSQIGLVIEKIPELSIFTNDGGKTWKSRKFPPMQNNFTLFLIREDLTLLLDSRGFLFKSKDNSGWELIKLNDEEWNSLIEKGLSSEPFIGQSFDGVIVCLRFIPEENRVLSIVSNDNGRSWTK